MASENAAPIRIRMCVTPSDNLTPEAFEKKLHGVLGGLNLPPYTLETSTRTTVPNANGRTTVTDYTLVIEGTSAGEKQKARMGVIRALDKALMTDYLNDGPSFSH